MSRIGKVEKDSPLELFFGGSEIVVIKGFRPLPVELIRHRATAA